MTEARKDGDRTAAAPARSTHARRQVALREKNKAIAWSLASFVAVVFVTVVTIVVLLHQAEAHHVATNF